MKIYVVTLGCDKNRVDTENLIGFLVRGGREIVNETEDADIFVINTCAFIQSAVKESLDVIFELSAYKKPIIVCGCLNMRYKNEITELGALPEASAFVENSRYDEINDVIDKVTLGNRVVLTNDGIYTFPSAGRILTTPPHYAYLKIAEGCNNRCLFCSIPYIRGKYTSLPMERILSEAKELNDSGVKEFILVAQDLTRYGTDIYGKPMLTELIRKLSSLNIRWLRLLYCYPECVDDELIEEIATNDKVAKYIDIPLQHISDNVLKRMGRKGDKRTIITLMDKLSKRNIKVRSTFMVGYPDESENDFLELCEFITNYPFENVGVFAYSREEGTPAYKLQGQIPQKTKKERKLKLERILSKKMSDNQQAKIGATVKVVYDGIDYDKQLFYGHSEENCPSVDKCVYFTSDMPLLIGEVYDVRITGVSRLDLKGEVR